MRTPNNVIHDFETVYADVDPVLSHVCTALTRGVRQTHEFFDSRRRDVDNALFPALTRYFAKLELDDLGHDVQDEEDEYDDVEGVSPDSDALSRLRFRRQPLANNGLCLDMRHYKLRILKAETGGGIPDPGASMAKKRFFRQERQLELPLEGIQPVAQLNLVVLWEVDPRTHQLVEFWLACPKTYRVKTREVLVHWKERLPRPVVPEQYRANQSQPAAANAPAFQELTIGLRSDGGA